jgi:hypothetical protein
VLRNPTSARLVGLPDIEDSGRFHLYGTNQEFGRHCAEGANGSGQLSIGESIQGVCLQEDLSPFVEELATQ